jgi:Spy/CpxP family protein refolding chaperone
MKCRIFCLSAILFLTIAMAHAQHAAPAAPTPPAQPAQPGLDALGRNFYPPELIMSNQEALQLTDEQQSYFKAEMRKAQMNFTELQWKLQDEGEKLITMTKTQRLDEQAILTQLEKVLNAEREVKRAQIALLVRLKNKLTPAQQAILNNMRHAEIMAPEARPDGE